MEIQTARKWYRWLWFSPLLTIPTFIILIFPLDPFLYNLICPMGNCDIDTSYRLAGVLAVLVSCLWHLVLLNPSFDKKTEFVRWHGRQALLLAGVRTATPLAFILILEPMEIPYPAILIIIPIWLFGTLWGQRQAARGDCSLMRWTGRADSLPGPPPDKDTGEFRELTTETLENTFRFSQDTQERQAALEELKNRGIVENL